MSRLPLQIRVAVFAALAVGVADAAPIEDRSGNWAPQDYGYGAPSVRVASTAAIDVRRSKGADAPQPRPQWLEPERVGAPYEAAGRVFAPAPQPGYEESGRAVRYPPGKSGVTASGAPFDRDALSAAHPTLPIPSLVQVTNLATGREVILRVTDRGPFGAGEMLALSDGAANALGVPASGGAVHVRYLGPAPRPVAARQAPTSRQARANAVHLQVGVFAAEANARRAEAQLGSLGPVKVEPLAQGARALFRVRLGPFPTASAAEAARADAVRMGFTETRVVAG